MKSVTYLVTVEVEDHDEDLLDGRIADAIKARLITTAVKCTEIKTVHETDPMLPLIIKALAKHRDSVPFTAPEALGWRYEMLATKLTMLVEAEFHAR